MAVYRLGDIVRMRREALGMTQDELVQIYDGKQVGQEGANGAGSPGRPHGGRAGGVHGSNEICSVQVLRRIEKGGVGRAKNSVFRQFMVKMGLLPERIYASLLVTECRGLSLKSEIHAHMNRGSMKRQRRS